MSRFALLCLFVLVSDLPRRVTSLPEEEESDDDEDEEGSEYEEEEDSVTYTPRTVPSYMYRFTHGLPVRQNTPPENNATTVYVEPEFKRFCNDCEDYWHSKCHHYPHIYDDSRGNVIRTLGPKSIQELYRETGEDEYDDEYYEDDDEYGSEEEEEEDEEGEEEKEKEREEKDGKGKEHKEGGEKGEEEGKEGEKREKPKKKPEVLMKAEEVQAMRERLQQLDAQKGNKTKDHDINAVIQKAMAERKSGIVLTTLQPGVEPSTLNETTMTLEPETILFYMDHGKTIT
ncbi:hypothetical protein WDU94_000306, partial [Cyamophila willieti]